MAVTEIGISNRRARPMDFFELTKPRITFTVLLSTIVGFYMGSPGPLEVLPLLHTILGTALVAAGASALNQYLERDLDALMVRTRNRPIPDGRLSPAEALTFSLAISMIGTIYLAFFVNLLAAALGVFTIATYLFLYTPLKTRTTWCTLVGAFPGATPPLIGWAAATHGSLNVAALSLFAIMLLWQMPHFFAISWMCTEDYARAGFKVHSSGVGTARQIIFYGCALIPVSLLPTLFQVTGRWYLLGALILGFIYLGYGVAVALRQTNTYAQRLLKISVSYLLLLFVLMIVDKA
jgi:protoheme IX farnesyltransferase